MQKPAIVFLICGAIAGCGSTAQIERAAVSQPVAAAPKEPVTVFLTIDGYGTIRTTADTVTVAGKAERGSNVLVDGIRAQMRVNGRWSRKIHAVMGRRTVTIQAIKSGRDDDIETITVVRKSHAPEPPSATTPPAAPEPAAAPKPNVPLSRWAHSSFKGGYLAGRRECGASSVSSLAQQYGVHADVPDVVAAFAREHGYYNRDPSADMNALARQAAYQGCLEGFESQGVR